MKLDAYKKKLPLYVAGGVMEGGRKLEHMARYSACMVIDIDDSPIPVLELLRRAAELPVCESRSCQPFRDRRQVLHNGRQ